jgi:hypothetical protein
MSSIITVFGELRWQASIEEDKLMSWKGTLGLGGTGFLALAMLTSTHAATPLNNTLKGFTGDSSQAGTQAALASAGLTVFNTSGLNDNGTPADPLDDFSPALSYDAGGAHFGALAGGDNGRNYMRTVDSDYATVDFVAEITFEVTNNDQASFFGLGSGDAALFGTPDWSLQVSSASFWPEPANDKIVAFKTANDVNAFVDKPVPGLDPGVHRLRMSFDATSGFLIGSIDLNYAGGAFAADATTLPIATKAGASPLFAADGWPSEPSRVFFGGDDGVIFHDLAISVVPEPMSAGLLVVGAMALLRRRRQL